MLLMMVVFSACLGLALASMGPALLELSKVCIIAFLAHYFLNVHSGVHMTNRREGDDRVKDILDASAAFSSS